MSHVYIAGDAIVGPRPVVGYRNMFSDAGGVVTASGAHVDYPKENAYDEIGTDYWMPAISGENWLQIDTAPAVVYADYMAFARHTFGTDAATVVAQYWDGTAWVDCFAPIAVADNDAVLVVFDKVGATKWRVLVDSVGTPRVGALNLGELLTMERGLFVGHAPEKLNRVNRISGGRTEGGVPLPATVVRAGVSSSPSIRNLSAAFIHAEIEPFMRHAESRRPFFWAWNPQQYPEQVAWMAVTEDPKAVPSSVGGPAGLGYWDFSFSMRGVFR